jgi:hypothetical protein
MKCCVDARRAVRSRKADFDSEEYTRMRFLSRLTKSRALAGNVCSIRERSALGCG